MRQLASIGQMTEEILEMFLDERQIDGIIFGDYFCNRRMYVNGLADMLFYAARTAERGKDIYYQTPMYVTSRNFSYVLETAEMLRSICSREGLNLKIFVQDAGVVCAIRERMEEVELIWGQLGRNRENTVTKAFLLFLRDICLDSVVVADIGRLKAYQEAGLQVYGVYGDYHCQAFGRTCYNTDQIGKEPEKCSRYCWDGWYLFHENQEYKLSMDGYVLGETYIYNLSGAEKCCLEQEAKGCLICAKDIGQWEKNYEVWMGLK